MATKPSRFQLQIPQIEVPQQAIAEPAPPPDLSQIARRSDDNTALLRALASQGGSDRAPGDLLGAAIIQATSDYKQTQLALQRDKLYQERIQKQIDQANQAQERAALVANINNTALARMEFIRAQLAELAANRQQMGDMNAAIQQTTELSRLLQLAGNASLYSDLKSLGDMAEKLPVEGRIPAFLRSLEKMVTVGEQQKNQYANAYHSGVAAGPAILRTMLANMLEQGGQGQDGTPDLGQAIESTIKQVYGKRPEIANSLLERFRNPTAELGNAQPAEATTGGGEVSDATTSEIVAATAGLSTAARLAYLGFTGMRKPGESQADYHKRLKSLVPSDPDGSKYEELVNSIQQAQTIFRGAILDTAKRPPKDPVLAEALSEVTGGNIEQARTPGATVDRVRLAEAISKRLQTPSPSGTSEAGAQTQEYILDATGKRIPFSRDKHFVRPGTDLVYEKPVREIPPTFLGTRDTISEIYKNKRSVGMYHREGTTATATEPLTGVSLQSEVDKKLTEFEAWRGRSRELERMAAMSAPKSVGEKDDPDYVQLHTVANKLFPGVVQAANTATASYMLTPQASVLPGLNTLLSQWEATSPQDSPENRAYAVIKNTLSEQVYHTALELGNKQVAQAVLKLNPNLATKLASEYYGRTDPAMAAKIEELKQQLPEDSPQYQRALAQLALRSTEDPAKITQEMLPQLNVSFDIVNGKITPSDVDSERNAIKGLPYFSDTFTLPIDVDISQLSPYTAAARGYKQLVEKLTDRRNQVYQMLAKRDDTLRGDIQKQIDAIGVIPEELDKLLTPATRGIAKSYTETIQSGLSGLLNSMMPLDPQAGITAPDSMAALNAVGQMQNNAQPARQPVPQQPPQPQPQPGQPQPPPPPQPQSPPQPPMFNVPGGGSISNNLVPRS